MLHTLFKKLHSSLRGFFISRHIPPNNTYLGFQQMCLERATTREALIECAGVLCRYPEMIIDADDILYMMMRQVSQQIRKVYFDHPIQNYIIPQMTFMWDHRKLFPLSKREEPFKITIKKSTIHDFMSDCKLTVTLECGDCEFAGKYDLMIYVAEDYATSIKLHLLNHITDIFAEAHMSYVEDNLERIAEEKRKRAKYFKFIIN